MRYPYFLSILFLSVWKRLVNSCPPAGVLGCIDGLVNVSMRNGWPAFDALVIPESKR